MSIQSSRKFVLGARALVAAVALCAMPLAARAVEVPATCVTQDTSLVVWVDFTAIHGEDVTTDLMKLKGTSMSAADKAKAEEFVKAFVAFRDQFVAGGGEGILFGMAQPAKEGDKPEAYMLVKTKAGADRAKLEKLMHGLAEQAKDNAQVSTAILAAKVEKYGNSTEWHALTGESLVFPPLNGTAKEAGVFNTALKPGGKSVFQLCFRMTPKMKSDMKAHLDEQAKNPDQGNMMMGMLGGVMSPLVNLDTVTVIGDGTKGARKINGSANFSDAKSAKEFAGAFNGLMEMAKGMAGMQMAQMSKYGVDTKNVNDIMAAINLKDSETAAVLTLDDAFFAKVEKFAEQAQAAQAKMMADHGPRKAGPGTVAADQADDGDDAKELDQAEKKVGK